MNGIDWSKAPEWATKHGYVSSDCLPVWLNSAQYTYFDGRQSGRLFSFAGCEGWAMDQIFGITKRPNANAWDGGGLPPVGSTPEVGYPQHRQPHEREWRSVEVLAHGVFRGVPVAICQDGDTILTAEACVFRPIRTLEQIATEEREQELNRMVATASMLDKGWARKVCAELYDAGYRKFEIVDGDPSE